VVEGFGVSGTIPVSIYKEIAGPTVDYIIVGTDHPLQGSDSQDTRLKDLLQSLTETHPVVLIAEEVKTSKDVPTFGRKLIGEDKWLSIDMCKEKRKEEGFYDIPCEEGPGSDNVSLVNRYHTKREAIREDFWIRELTRWCEDRQIVAGTVVVTCGHNHMRAGFLADKLRQLGHKVSTRECMNYDVDTLGSFIICQ
jgi:hypothetical protein